MSTYHVTFRWPTPNAPHQHCEEATDYIHPIFTTSAGHEEGALSYVPSRVLEDGEGGQEALSKRIGSASLMNPRLARMVDSVHYGLTALRLRRDPKGPTRGTVGRNTIARGHKQNHTRLKAVSPAGQATRKVNLRIFRV